MYCGMSRVLSDYRYVDTSSLWDSLAFVSNGELSANVPLCRKVLPEWCMRMYFYVMSAYEYRMSITIFKEMGRRKFRLARHRKNEERNIVHRCSYLFPEVL